MAKFKINDIELEYDILELENAEKFEKAVLKAQSEAAAAEKETSLPLVIKKQCTAVFDFIDTLFGKGKHKEIFGDSVNLRTCVKAFSDICAAMEKDNASFVSEIKPKQNREQRRAAKKK